MANRVDALCVTLREGINKKTLGIFLYSIKILERKETEKTADFLSGVNKMS